MLSRKVFFTLLFIFLCSLPSFAAPTLLSPSKAVISPTKASLYCETSLPVERAGKEVFVRFLLPLSATDVQVFIPGKTIVLKSESLASIAEGYGKRSSLLLSLAELKGELQALDATLKGIVKTGEEGYAIDTEYVKALSRAREERNLRCKVLQEFIDSLPSDEGKNIARCIRVVLESPVEEDSVSLVCSYIDTGCRWTPEYRVNCVPQAEGKGRIDLVLEAVVSRGQGPKWQDVDITLATVGSGGAQLPSLGTWLVGREAPVIRSNRYAEHEAVDMDGSAKVLMAAPVAKSAPATREVQTKLSGEYASWHPGLLSLEEGINRVVMSRVQWNEKLHWIARPRSQDAKVYLSVEHELEKASVWPIGKASLCVDGIPVGKMTLSPRKGKITLSFGNDPRVCIATFALPRTLARTGLLNQKRNWDWAWEYTVRNDRDSAVLVRIERPLPQVVDDKFSIEVKNSPEAKIEQKTLFWEVSVLPHATESVRHEVKVVGPESASSQQVEPEK